MMISFRYKRAICDFKKDNMISILRWKVLVLQTKQHLHNSEKSVMGCKRDFIPISIGSFYLTVTATSIERGKYCEITERVDRFINTKYGV